MSECSLCGGTGWRPVEKNGWRAVEVCSCRRQARDEQWWMEQARIPRGFREEGKDFNNFYDLGNPSLQMALIKARGFVDNYLVPAKVPPKGLLFMGSPGVGKTHLAIAIMKQLMMQKGVDCLFCSYPEFLEQVLQTYDPISSQSSASIIQPVLETEVVLIDDLGARRTSDWVEDTVTYVLNYRYNEKKATLVTSNLPDNSDEVKERSPSGKYRIGDTLTDRIGLRVRSRLYEMCELVRISANDFRQTVQAHSR